MKSLLLLSISLFVTSAFAELQEPPHYDLEMTSEEYRKLVKVHKTNVFDFEVDYVNDSIKAGERLLSWLEKINAQRPEDQKIRLTSKSTRKGIPISKPKKYGPSTIKATYGDLSTSIPAEMIEVIFKNQAATADPLVDDKTFIKYGRKVDRMYQTAARWRMLSPFKGALERRRVRDVRGLYYLVQNGWDRDKFNRNFAGLEAEEREEVNKALAGLCMNNGRPFTTCLTEARRMITGAEAAAYHGRYIRRAQAAWDSFYEIRGNRRDITWNGADATEARIPFKDPRDPAVLAFVKDNVEDEFKWGDWGLKLDIVQGGNVPYIRFVPGATPNVNGLGGNRITMDANKSIEEYAVQWTIRHEYGHVIGLPDCYHEFYDRDNNLMINYQLDTADLMCSRAGNMNERIYLQMREAYAR